MRRAGPEAGCAGRQREGRAGVPEPRDRQWLEGTTGHQWAAGLTGSHTPGVPTMCWPSTDPSEQLWVGSSFTPPLYS